MSPPSSSTFEAQFEEALPALSAWASLRLRGPLQRELSPGDLVQEVACRAYASRDRYDAAQGPYRGWIFGIARNVLLRALEDMAAGSRAMKGDWLSTDGVHRIPDEATSVTQAVMRSERLREFMERTAELEEAEQKLVLLRGLEGLSFHDVALQIGIGEKAAAKRWERLRERLQSSWASLNLEN